MQILPDASAESLGAFVSASVEPGSHVITDGWPGYRGLPALGYPHEPRSQRAARLRGEDPGELLPVVHRVASLAKALAAGHPQGGVQDEHCPTTSTSSSSASTAAAPGAAAWSSTASFSWPWPTRRCATATWSPTPRARRALTGSQITTIAGWRRREESLGIATARTEAVRLAKRILDLDAELADNRVVLTRMRAGLVLEAAADLLGRLASAWRRSS